MNQELLDDYLGLIDQERDRRPSETVLADEIRRLRAENEHLRGLLWQFVDSHVAVPRKTWGQAAYIVGYDEMGA